MVRVQWSVVLRFCKPLCAHNRCAPDASGAHLTASGGLQVTVRVRRVRFKVLTHGCFWSTGRSFPAFGASPAVSPVTPCFAQ